VSDMSIAQRKGDSTSLDSFQITNVSCIAFKFNTDGTSVDNMRVVLTTDNDVNRIEATVWQLEGNFGKQWKTAQIPVTNSGIPMKVRSFFD